MVLFAVTSVFSVGMLLPFLNVLFVETPEAAVPVAVAPGVSSEELDALEQSLPEKVGHLRQEVKDWIMGFFLRPSPVESLARVCIGLLIFTFFKGLFAYGQRFLLISVEQAVIRDLRDDLYRHIHRLSLSFFHGRRTGQILSRITYDVTLVRQAVSAVFTNLVRDALLVVFYLGIVLWISWRLALVSFVVLPPMMYVIARVSRKLRKYSAASQQRMADITAVLQETVSGIRIVKAFAMERPEIEKFRGRTQGYYKSLVKLQRVGSLATPLAEFLAVVGALVVLWYGGLQVLEGGGLSPDWFIIFVASMISAMSPIKKLTQVNTQIQEGLVAARRVFDLLDTEPDILEKPGAVELDGVKEGIEFHSVSFCYEQERPVLEDVSLRVNAGEVVAVVGPSGAGKSTLVDLVPRFYDPTSGRVTLDASDLRDVTLRSLRQLMGIVSQETILFNDSIRNNIAYGMLGADEGAIVAAAKAANAHAFIEAFPEGYETVIGDRGVKLSGGERQRVAIARAILKNPPILILDEATSSLDSESEFLVQEALDRLMADRTTLVIAHRLSTIQTADKIVVMEGGRIHAVGDHETLLSRPGVYRRLYETQFRQRQAGSPN
jgi:subfamily B ATP-binding cassette protein MsbA